MREGWRTPIGASIVTIAVISRRANRRAQARAYLKLKPTVTARVWAAKSRASLPSQIEVWPGTKGLSWSLRQSVPSNFSKVYLRLAVQDFAKRHRSAVSRRNIASSMAGKGLTLAVASWEIGR